MFNHVSEVQRKEAYTTLDGHRHLTGKIIKEWHSFNSYAEAHEACKKARQDDTVVDANVITAPYYRLNDYQVRV